MGLVAGAALQVTRQMQSLEAAQRLCDSMLVTPSPGGSFFQAAISMELAGMWSMPNYVPRMQRLFEVSPLLLMEKPLMCNLKVEESTQCCSAPTYSCFVRVPCAQSERVIPVHIHECCQAFLQVA